MSTSNEQVSYLRLWSTENIICQETDMSGERKTAPRLRTQKGHGVCVLTEEALDAGISAVFNA